MFLVSWTVEHGIRILPCKTLWRLLAWTVKIGRRWDMLGWITKDVTWINLANPERHLARWKRKKSGEGCEGHAGQNGWFHANIFQKNKSTLLTDFFEKYALQASLASATTSEPTSSCPPSTAPSPSVSSPATPLDVKPARALEASDVPPSLVALAARKMQLQEQLLECIQDFYPQLCPSLKAISSKGFAEKKRCQILQLAPQNRWYISQL